MGIYSPLTGSNKKRHREADRLIHRYPPEAQGLETLFELNLLTKPCAGEASNLLVGDLHLKTKRLPNFPPF